MIKQADAEAPGLSVIICSFNRGFLLEACIAAVGEQLDEANAELVVVVDGSTDNTNLILDQLHVPMVRGGWIQNRGLNAARNEGLRLASAPIALYFDDDQIPPDGYLKAVLAAFMSHNVDGVGGPLRDKGGGLRTCAKCSLGDTSLGNEPQFTSRLIGGNMALRKSAFDQIGPFDTRLSGRGDETEWFSRASALRFYYDPALWVWHRRDAFNVRELCRYAYRQGRATPVFESIMATKRPGRARRATRHLAHTMRYRCSHGLELLCRELGAITASARRKKLLPSNQAQES